MKIINRRASCYSNAKSKSWTRRRSWSINMASNMSSRFREIGQPYLSISARSKAFLRDNGESKR